MEAAVKRATELSREAELAWKENQDAARALALYQQAVDLCLEAEEKNPKANLGSLRFRRAFCETQMDRVKFDAATGSQRRIAVMGAPGATPPAAAPPADAGNPEAPVPEAARATGAGAQPAEDGARPVADGLAWARDMLDANGDREAREALMAVLRVEPDNRTARLLLAALECKRQAFQDALFILEDLQAEREDECVQLLIAGAYLGAKQPYRAMLELDKLLARTPTHPDALMNMAHLSMELSGKPAEAERYYRLAVAFGAPRDPDFEKRLGF